MPHDENDVDTGRVAGHHTIGVSNHQAAAGDHSHNGENSVALLNGMTLTGSRDGNVALISIIAALVSLGAEDSTTP